MRPHLPSWLRGPCPYSQRWMLDNPVRRLLQPRARALDAIGLPAGGRALELGSGSGYFTFDAAKRLGAEGRLVCVDLQPKMARYLRRRLDEGGVGNVDVIVGDAMNLPLRPDSFDAAFLVTVLGELPNRQRGIAELRRAIRDGGTLSISEVLPDPHYQPRGRVRRECEAGGFRFQQIVRRPLGFVMNFVAATAIESADSAPARSP
jgi:ubiquinone/menaquinone biosynthesis C-methylase UbiE